MLIDNKVELFRTKNYIFNIGTRKNKNVIQILMKATDPFGIEYYKIVVESDDSINNNPIIYSFIEHLESINHNNIEYIKKLFGHHDYYEERK